MSEHEKARRQLRSAVFDLVHGGGEAAWVVDTLDAYLIARGVMTEENARVLREFTATELPNAGAVSSDQPPQPFTLAAPAQGETPKRPEIVCLCGSTRFIETFAVMAWLLEKEGAIALGLHYLPPSYPNVPADHLAEAEGVKEQMDELHKRKIDLADRVLVLNIGGYVGESTRSEIAYAEAHGKPVAYLEPVPQTGAGEGGAE